MSKDTTTYQAAAPVRIFIGAMVLAATATTANAATLTSVEQAVNIFNSGSVTGGVPLTVDVGGPTAITGGLEFPGFAFGTYDVDVSASSLTMTFVNDPADLGISVYDASTVDSYFFEFDQAIASASISSFTDGFGAAVEIIAPGTTASSMGSFVDGLPTSFVFGNGGILITIAEGTDLNLVGTGGSLTVEFAPVPLPAALPFLLSGLAGLGLLRRRKR